MTARRLFFEALFGGAEAGHWFILWATPEKVTYAFPANADGITAALAKCDELDNGSQNVYVGTYLLSEPPRQGRGTVSDVVATTAFWIDIDIKGPNHKSDTAYPPTVAEAERILDTMPIQPSAVFNTGGGLHAWYFFPEPLYFEDADARTEIAELRDRWRETVQSATRSLGYAVDNVWDFARVMRVPETLNPKSTPPIRGTLHYIEPLRQYGHGDLDEVLKDLPGTWTDGKPAPISMEGIELRYLDARPEKLLLALEEDMKFRRTWQRKRRDLEDQSPSAYSFAIAIYLVKLGLTDEQIVQTLYTWRRDNQASPKDDAWYAKTVGRARQRAGVQSQAAAFLGDFRAGEADDRSELLKGLSALLGFGVDDVQMIDGDEPTYRVTHDGVSRKFGTTANILSQQRFRERVAQFGILLKSFNKEQWNDVVAVFLAAARLRELGEMGTEAGRASEWIRKYLISRSLSVDTTPREAFHGDRPFWWKDRVCIHGNNLFRFIRDRMRVESGLTVADFDQAMEQAGCYLTDKRWNYYPGGARHTVRAWVIPTAFHEDGADDE